MKLDGLSSSSDCLKVDSHLAVNGLNHIWKLEPAYYRKNEKKKKKNPKKGN